MLFRSTECSLVKRVFVQGIGVPDGVGKRSHLAGRSLFGLLACIKRSFQLTHLLLQLSLEVGLQLLLPLGHELVSLGLQVVEKGLPDAFSFLLRVKVLGIFKESLLDLLSLDLLFNLALELLVLLDGLFGLRHLELHLLLRRKHTQLDGTALTSKQVRWNVGKHAVVVGKSERHRSIDPWF